MKNTWEKIFEYASMPVHGTLSRKLRKGLSLQINEGKVYNKAVIGERAKGLFVIYPRQPLDQAKRYTFTPAAVPHYLLNNKRS